MKVMLDNGAKMPTNEVRRTELKQGGLHDRKRVFSARALAESKDT